MATFVCYIVMYYDAHIYIYSCYTHLFCDLHKFFILHIHSVYYAHIVTLNIYNLTHTHICCCATHTCNVNYTHTIWTTHILYFMHTAWATHAMWTTHIQYELHTYIVTLHTCIVNHRHISYYMYIYIKCIVTNKYAYCVLEYNHTNSQKICTSHFNSNDFIKKCDVSVLLGPSTGEHIRVCRNKSTSERVQFSDD